MKNSQLIATLKTHAYFYLIGEREFAVRGDDVYKLGITAQVMDLNVSRFRGYKKGSELIMITECPMAMLGDIEKSIKELFCKRFVKHDDGHEYFLGNHRQMANLIYKACDDAWTEEQQQIKKDTLKSVLQLIDAGNHPAKDAARKPQDADDSSKMSDTVPQEMEISAKGAESSANGTEKAAEERLALDEQNFHQWFKDRVQINATAFVKQAIWYPDYRSWAVRCNITPISEGMAVATFKRLYGGQGISVGNKTYGVQMINLSCQTESDHSPAENVNSIRIWLETVAQTGGTGGAWIRGRDIFQKFVKWASNQSIKDEWTEHRFGKEMKKCKGVYFKRSNGSQYCIKAKEVSASIVAGA